MYIRNNMSDLTYSEMDKILRRHPNIMKEFSNLHDPEKIARRVALKSLRETAMNVVDSAINEDHEDACYDLAYSLHSNIICDFKSYFGYTSESDVLRVILKDPGSYNTLLQLNNSMYLKDKEARDQQRRLAIIKEMQKYVYYTQEYGRIMQEYNKCLLRAKGLGSTV